MRDRQLHASIVHDPHDLDARAVYADALGDDPRGAFIQLQLRAETEPDRLRRRDLAEEAERLLARHRRRWTEALWSIGPLGESPSPPAPDISDVQPRLVVRRGFVEGLRVTPAELPSSLEAARLAPLRSLELVEPTIKTMRALAESSSLEPFTELAIGRSNQEFRDEFRDARDALITSPHLGALLELRLANEAAELPSVPAFARLGQLSSLRVLDLGFDAAIKPALDPARVAPLFAGPLARSLRTLRLANRTIGDEAAAALAPAIPHLEELDLSGCELGPRGLDAISAAGPAQLVSIDLTGLALDAPTLRRLLAAAPRLARVAIGGSALLHEMLVGLIEARVALASLSIVGTGSALAPEHITRLMRDARSPELRELVLRDCPVGFAAVRALAVSRRWARLERLVIEACEVGDEGIRALANAELPALTHLTIHRAEIRSTGAAALAAAPFLEGLRSLDLVRNPIGTGGAKALAHARSMAALEVLRIGGTAMGEDGVAALFARPDLGRLRVLHLGDEAAAQAVRTVIANDAIEHLDELAGYWIDGYVADVLAQRRLHLATLDIRGASLSDVGAQLFARAPAFDELQQLLVAPRGLTTAGARTLRKRFGPGVCFVPDPHRYGRL